VKGYCEECARGQTVQNAVICPACDGLCVRATQYEERQTRGRQQARSLMEDLGTIVAYPLRDPLGLVMLALFTWFFGLAAKMAMFGGVVGIVLSQGVLLSYCFFAVSRVASGNLHDFTPDFRGISDFVEPLRLGLAVLIISYGPLLVMGFVAPGMSLLTSEAPHPGGLDVAHAQPPPSPDPEPETDAEPDAEPEESASPSTEESREAAREEEREEALARPSRAASAGIFVALGLALFWKLAYTPAALTVAALSRSFFKVLNPILGLDTIRRMGGIYWQALVIYSVLAFVQWAAGVGLAFIPIAGGLVSAFVDAYAYLAIGCTLGLAVFKKARELGWD
jgi:hypothetical protein